MTVLIVEDQLDSLENVKEILEKREFTVLHAENLHEAKELFEKNLTLIDAIVTDLNMHPKFIAKKNEQLQESCGSNFAGWVWLKYYVFKDYPAFLKKTALRSAYIGELEAHLRYKDEEKDRLALVKKIERRNDSLCEELLPWLQSLKKKIHKPHGMKSRLHNLRNRRR